MEVTAIVSATAAMRQRWNFDIRSAMIEFRLELLARGDKILIKNIGRSGEILI